MISLMIEGEEYGDLIIAADFKRDVQPMYVTGQGAPVDHVQGLASLDVVLRWDERSWQLCMKAANASEPLNAAFEGGCYTIASGVMRWDRYGRSRVELEARQAPGSKEG